MLRELDSGGVCKTSTHMAQVWKNILLVQTLSETWQNVCVCKKVFNESIVSIFTVLATNVSWYQNMCPPTRLGAGAGSLGSMSKEPRGFGLGRRQQVPSPTLCWRQGAYMPVRMYYEGTSCTSPLPSGGVSLWNVLACQRSGGWHMLSLGSCGLRTCSTLHR